MLKPTRCINFSNLFFGRELHVSDSFSVHRQESTTVYTAIGICVKFVNAKQAKETYQYRNTQKNCVKPTRKYCITKYAEVKKYNNIGLFCFIVTTPFGQMNTIRPPPQNSEQGATQCK